MDVIEQLGALALGSRLKRLHERISQDVTAIYKDQNIAFEPRWFPIYYLLSQKGPLSIVELSKELGISHPCVNQIAADLIKHGLVQALKDKSDKRKRLLDLTAQGRDLLPALQSIWNGVDVAVRDFISSTGVDVLGVLQRMEQTLGEQSMHTRFTNLQKERQIAAIEILENPQELLPYFKTLNYEWIEKYFRIEPEDERVLSNPEREILKHGGYIFFARENNEILGTCALIKHSENTYELAKMAVTEKARGRQIGKKLLLSSIQKARELQASCLTLETNSKLTTAINLYRKLGFVLVPFVNEEGFTLFERADVRMRLDLE